MPGRFTSQGSTRTSGDRNFASHPLRPATARYGLQSLSASRDTHTSRNFFTDIEALKGIGVADNKLLQAHSKADNHNPGSPDAA